MSIMRSIIKPIATKAYKYQTYIKLSQLRNIKQPAAANPANAMYNALKNNLDPEEKKWVERIEEKRKMLNSSSTKISITDFGERTPGSARTENETYQGVTKETTVGEMCQMASKPFFCSFLLFKLVREFKPSKSIELGTCRYFRSISSICSKA